MSRNLVQLIDKLKLASPTMAENHIQGPNSNEHELACENRIVRVVAPAVYRLWQLQCWRAAAPLDEIGVARHSQSQGSFPNGANQTSNFESWVLIKTELLVCRSTTYA